MGNTELHRLARIQALRRTVEASMPYSSSFLRRVLRLIPSSRGADLIAAAGGQRQRQQGPLDLGEHPLMQSIGRQLAFEGGEIAGKMMLDALGEAAVAGLGD